MIMKRFQVGIFNRCQIEMREFLISGTIYRSKDDLVVLQLYNHDIRLINYWIIFRFVFIFCVVVRVYLRVCYFCLK